MQASANINEPVGQAQHVVQFYAASGAGTAAVAPPRDVSFSCADVVRNELIERVDQGRDVRPPGHTAVLEREGVLERWHSFEADAVRGALKQRCAENALDLVDT